MLLPRRLTLATLAALLAAMPALADTLHVPVDPRTTYQVLQLQSIEPGVVEILTRRGQTQGAAFTLREVDCARMLLRRLGEGVTAEAALKSRVSAGEFSRLTPGSVSWHISRHACATLARQAQR
jgi:hypothetical protein